MFLDNENIYAIESELAFRYLNPLINGQPAGMGCTEGELYRLMDLLYLENYSDH